LPQKVSSEFMFAIKGYNKDRDMKDAMDWLQEQVCVKLPNYFLLSTLSTLHTLLSTVPEPALWPRGKTLAQISGGAWFDPLPSHTKDFKIGISS
ncbi:hypothetical protein ElyMa_003170300, partial [Elysia marginata]